MSFPGLYNEVTHVSTEPTTVLTAAAVLTHVLHLLMNLLMYISIYCTCTRTYYTYCCPVRTTYWHTYELHCWCTYVYIYIYIEKKGNAAEQIGTYCTYMLYARTAPTDVLTAFTYCWCTYVYWRKNYELLQIRTYCCTFVPTALTWYSCTYWCTYAPTAHSAAPTGARTYPPYVLLL